MLDGEYKGVKYTQIPGGFKVKWPSGLVAIVKLDSLQALIGIIDGSGKP